MPGQKLQAVAFTKASHHAGVKRDLNCILISMPAIKLDVVALVNGPSGECSNPGSFIFGSRKVTRMLMSFLLSKGVMLSIELVPLPVESVPGCNDREP